MNRRTRPGVDRISMQLLNAAIGTYANMLVMHGKECHTCTTAGTNAFAHCTKWWEIKTELHRLQKQKGFAISGYVPGQDELPGMEPSG